MRFIWIFICVLSHVTASAQTVYDNQHDAVNVENYHFKIDVNDIDNTIRGIAEITLVLKDATPDKISFDLIGKNQGSKTGMTVESVELQRSLLGFSLIKDRLLIELPSGMKQGQKITIKIVYNGEPADGLIISKSRNGDRTFFGDNWPNRARHWLPVVDHPSDKASVRWTVSCPQHYRVVANGKLISENIVDRGYNTFVYEEKAPIATKVMVVGIASFAKTSSGKLRDVQVSSWGYKQDSALVFSNYAEAVPIVTYFDSLIGPFSYVSLANVQSKTIFGGMENAGCIFYSESILFSEPNWQMTSLLAHEIGHQWFGNSVSEKDYSHIWLSEGFATFLAAHYLEKKYGVDKMRQELIANRAKVITFSGRNPTTPIIDHTQDDLMSLLNPNSYEKGGWVLHMLRAEIGEVAFWATLQLYYKQYQNSNATTEDLRAIAEKQSGKDLKPFFDQWLTVGGMPEFTLTWSRKGDKIDVCIEQDAANLRSFPLELSFGAEVKSGKVERLEIKKVKKQNFTFSADQLADEKIWVDPRVILLAEWKVKKK
jgi:aminopeptidase N